MRTAKKMTSFTLVRFFRRYPLWVAIAAKLSTVAVLLPACTATTIPSSPQAQKVQPSTGSIEFVLSDAEGAPVSSESLRGRRSLLVFVTTYDLGAQLVARRVEEVLRTARPRVNALGVVMERGTYLPLLETYAEATGLSYPLVLADGATFDGRGPLGDVDYVPTIVVLDDRLRRVFKLQGAVTVREIEQALSQVQ